MREANRFVRDRESESGTRKLRFNLYSSSMLVSMPKERWCGRNLTA